MLLCGRRRGEAPEQEDQRTAAQDRKRPPGGARGRYGLFGWEMSNVAKQPAQRRTWRIPRHLRVLHAHPEAQPIWQDYVTVALQIANIDVPHVRAKSSAIDTCSRVA